MPEHVESLHVEAAFASKICEEELLIHNVGRSFDLEYTGYVVSLCEWGGLDLIPDHVDWTTAENTSWMGDGTAPAGSGVVAGCEPVVKPLYT